MPYNQVWQHNCGHQATAIVPFGNTVDNIETVEPHPVLLIPGSCPRRPDSISDAVLDENLDEYYDAEDEYSSSSEDDEPDAGPRQMGTDSYATDCYSSDESLAGGDPFPGVTGLAALIASVYQDANNASSGELPSLNAVLELLELESLLESSSDGDIDAHHHKYRFGMDGTLSHTPPPEWEDGKFVYYRPILTAGGRALMWIDLNTLFGVDAHEIALDARGVVGSPVVGRGLSSVAYPKVQSGDEKIEGKTASETDVEGKSEDRGRFGAKSAARVRHDEGIRDPYWDFLYQHYGTPSAVRGPSTWSWDN